MFCCSYIHVTSLVSWERISAGGSSITTVLPFSMKGFTFGSADEKLDAAGRPDGRSACTTGIPWGWRCWRSRRA